MSRGRVCCCLLWLGLILWLGLYTEGVNTTYDKVTSAPSLLSTSRPTMHHMDYIRSRATLHNKKAEQYIHDLKEEMRHDHTEKNPRNKQLMSGGKQIRVACVGDSITQGFGSFQMKNSYPLLLGRQLGPDFVVMNFGVSSSTAMDVLSPSEFPYTSTKMFNNSIHSSPDIVLIQLGTNDAKSWNWDENYFILSYLRIVHIYRMLPTTPRIYVVIPPPVYKSIVVDHELSAIDATVINDKFPMIFRKLASNLRVPVIDFFDVLGGRNQSKIHDNHMGLRWTSDGIHPNDRGYEVLAKEAMKILMQTPLIHDKVVQSQDPLHLGVLNVWGWLADG